MPPHMAKPGVHELRRAPDRQDSDGWRRSAHRRRLPEQPRRSHPERPSRHMLRRRSPPPPCRKPSLQAESARSLRCETARHKATGGDTREFHGHLTKKHDAADSPASSIRRFRRCSKSRFSAVTLPVMTAVQSGKSGSSAIIASTKRSVPFWGLTCRSSRCNSVPEARWRQTCHPPRAADETGRGQRRA